MNKKYWLILGLALAAVYFFILRKKNTPKSAIDESGIYAGRPHESIIVPPDYDKPSGFMSPEAGEKSDKGPLAGW